MFQFKIRQTNPFEVTVESTLAKYQETIYDTRKTNHSVDKRKETLEKLQDHSSSESIEMLTCVPDSS